MMMVRNSMPNSMFLSAGGNARFRSIPKNVSKFEIIERNIDEASKFKKINSKLLYYREEIGKYAK